MTKKPERPRLARRPLASLVEYPLQQALAGTTTEEDDEKLRLSIEEDGLKERIDIIPKNKARLPENSILDGHRRVAALKQLGEETAPVRVRYDLASADRATLDKEFLEANSIRRQLDPVARAYIAVKLMVIERQRPLDELMSIGYVAGEVRERVGTLLGISGRHLSRLLRVIQTPIEVQAAVRRKKLSIVLAAKVADLPDDIQSRIADRIGTGEDAKSVVECYVSKGRGKPARSVTEFSHYMKALRNLADRLGDSVDEIKFSATPEELELLKAGQKLHRELIKQLARNATNETKSLNRVVNALT